MRKRADNDEILQCVAAHTANGFQFYAEGVRVRRGDIDPFSAPYWTSDGSTPLELARLRQQLESGDASQQPAPAPKPQKMVVCTRSFAQPRSAVGPRGQATAMVAFNVGDKLPASHPIAREHAQFFQPAAA